MRRPIDTVMDFPSKTLVFFPVVPKLLNSITYKIKLRDNYNVLWFYLLFPAVAEGGGSGGETSRLHQGPGGPARCC